MLWNITDGSIVFPSEYKTNIQKYYHALTYLFNKDGVQVLRAFTGGLQIELV